MIRVPTVLQELLDALGTHEIDSHVIGLVRAEDARIAIAAALGVFEHQVGALNAADHEHELPSYREIWNAAIVSGETEPGRTLLRYTMHLEKRFLALKQAMTRTDGGEAATEAVARLLFAFHIYGPVTGSIDRGTAGCMRDAIRLLRPDIDQRLSDGESADDLYEELGEESDA